MQLYLSEILQELKSTGGRDYWMIWFARGLEVLDENQGVSPMASV